MKFFRFIVLTLLSLAEQARGQNTSAVAQQAEKLWQEPDFHKKWIRLLLFDAKGQESIIDSPAYFLAKDGKKNPRAELIKTLDIFESLIIKPLQKDDMRCKYAARYTLLARYIEAYRAFDLAKECPGMDTWLLNTNGHSISLVFSSYFLNNPASMFGHTFLRVHRAKAASALLDSAVSFGAAPTTENPILYILNGLTGGFPGYFSAARYYQKVQEYNNSESRDLWEYELNISPEQVSFLALLLWEFAPHPIDYYYLDENCSYIVLKLLEALDPKYDFSDRFYLFAIPSDTLRAVTEYPNIVRKIDFRPSAWTRMRARYDALNSAERSVFHSILDHNAISFAENFPSTSRAKVLDAVLEYISYDEKLYGMEKPKQRQMLYQQILAERSHLKELPEKFPEPEVNNRPDLSKPSSRIGFGLRYGFNEKLELLDFYWRPALHDLGENARGFSEGMEIRFMETKLTWSPERKNFGLSDLHLLRIYSLTPATSTPRTFSLSWFLDTAFEEDPWQEDALQKRISLTGGMGVAENLWKKQVAFFLVAPFMHFPSAEKFRGSYGYSGEVGLRLTPAEDAGVLLSVQKEFSYGGQKGALLHGRAQLRYDLSRKQDVAIEGTYSDEKKFFIGASTRRNF